MAQRDKSPRVYWFLGVFIAAVAVTALIATIIYIKFGRQRDSPAPAGFATCATVACREYVDMISTNMDKTVKPCDNFYEFVCGKEIRNPNWQSVFLDHKVSFILSSAMSLKSVLVPGGKQTAAEKAACLFQNCEGIIKGKRDELDRFKDVLKKYGIEWPRRSQQPDVLKTGLLIEKAFDVSTLFSIRYFHSNESVVVMSPGGTIGIYSEQRDRRLKQGTYENHFRSFKDAFKDPSDDEASLLRFDQFSKTEKTVLGELLGKVRGNVTVLRGLGELAARTPEIPKERWDTLLKQGLGVSDSPSLTIRVNSIAYLQAFSNLFSRLGEQGLVQYVGWLTIQIFAPLMNSYLASLWYGSTQEPSNMTSWRCTQLAEWYLGWATWLPRVKSVFTEDARKDIHSMISAIHTALKRKLQNNPSLIGANQVPPFEVIHSTLDLVDTPPAVVEAMYANTSDMGALVSENLRSAVESWERTNSTVLGRIRTFYANTLGYSIFLSRAVSPIPPFFATLPVYDYNVIGGVNYGALGSILAAPFFGSLFGSLTKEALKSFRCYLDTSPLANLGTSYYDRTASFSILWDAYKAAKGSETETRLYGFTEYTEDQVFFIAFCHMLCSVRIESEHFCNEPLRNSAKFAESFHCLEGSHMSPVIKCTLL